MRVARETVIRNKYGFHVRPSTRFMELAKKYHADVSVQANGVTANGKSIMDLMILGATQGTPITVVAEGEDAEVAVDALVELIDGQFGGIE